MKISKKVPTEAVYFVKTGQEDDRGEFEIWVVKPVFIEKVTKTGVKQIITSDGERFDNLNQAARHLLKRRGDYGLAEKINPKVIQMKSTKVLVRGIDIVHAGSWAHFCKLKQISPDDVGAIAKNYEVEMNELAELGMPLAAG